MVCIVHVFMYCSCALVLSFFVSFSLLFFPVSFVVNLKESLEQDKREHRHGPKGTKNFLANNSNSPSTPSSPGPVRREVEGNLTCEQPGCAADVMLHIYNPQEDCPLTGLMMTH